jgi:hypothetical protein
MYSNINIKAFDSILPIIGNAINVYRSSLVFISGEKAVVMSAHTSVRKILIRFLSPEKIVR